MGLRGREGDVVGIGMGMRVRVRLTARVGGLGELLGSGSGGGDGGGRHGVGLVGSLKTWVVGC